MCQMLKDYLQYCFFSRLVLLLQLSAFASVSEHTILAAHLSLVVRSEDVAEHNSELSRTAIPYQQIDPSDLSVLRYSAAIPQTYSLLAHSS